MTTTQSSNAISVRCLGIAQGVLQSACSLSQTNVFSGKVNSNDCTTEAYFRYASTQHYNILMAASDGIGIILPFFQLLPKDNCPQVLCTSPSLMSLHLSMFKGLKEAIKHPNFVCVRLNTKFNTNNFSMYLLMRGNFCHVA